MFLQVVSLVRNVGDHLVAIRQPYLRHLPHRRVRLFRRTRHYLQTNTAAERRTVKRRGLRLVLQFVAALADQLINRGHYSLFGKISRSAQPAENGREHYQPNPMVQMVFCKKTSSQPHHPSPNQTITTEFFFKAIASSRTASFDYLVPLEKAQNLNLRVLG